MILVDTSVWIDHLREGDERLQQLLLSDRVYTHPMIIGELACGNLHNRNALIDYLYNLPKTPVVSDHEAMHCLNQHKLFGRGIGYIDLHLLSATLVSEPCKLWSRDKRLQQIAHELNIGFANH